MSKPTNPDFVQVLKAIIMSIKEWFFKLDLILRIILATILIAVIVRVVAPDSLASVFGISIFAIIYVAYIRLKNSQAQLENKYYSIRERLRENPYDNSLREAVLQAGRQYYASLRGGGRLTIYDEQAIANDLASIVPIVSQSNEVSNSKSKVGNDDNNDIVGKLQKLTELKDSGLISELEFEAKRKKILDEL